MKKTITFIFTCVLTFFIQANEKVLPSKINSVTVYPSNAQIERMADYQIGKGEQKLIIDNVSPYLDPNTLQVKLSGKALVLDAQFKTVYPQPNANNNELPDKIKKSIFLIEDSIDAVSLKINQLNMELEIWTTQKQMLLNNGTMKGQGKVNDSIPLLKDALKFYSEKMTEIKKAEFEINQKIKKKNEELSGMNKRKSEYQNYHNKTQPNPSSKTRYQIILTVMSEVSTAGKINVKYVVSGAGWVPTYDLIQENGSDGIKLNFKAKITQNTGENWDNVPLVLATNNPSANKNKPVLNPWYIQQQHLMKERESMKRSHSGNYPASTDQEEVADRVQYNNKTVAQYTNRVEQLIHANYNIGLRYSIPSNGEVHHVMIAQENLKTNYKHYVVPKMDLSTYLVAEVTGWGDLQLQAGEAQIYFDGSFVGKTHINPNIMKDTLELSLGQDPSIVVERKLLNKNNKEKLIGDKKIQTIAYEITYKNNKSKTIEMVIQDQIPLSQSDIYEIELTKSDKAQHDEGRGFLTWNKAVKPYGSGKVTFEYSVTTGKNNYISMY